MNCFNDYIENEYKKLELRIMLDALIGGGEINILRIKHAFTIVNERLKIYNINKGENECMIELLTQLMIKPKDIEWICKDPLVRHQIMRILAYAIDIKWQKCDINHNRMYS